MRGRYFSFCASVPPSADQLGGDLRARAERADADIAARQLLGDHAHGELAEAEPAPLPRARSGRRRRARPSPSTTGSGISSSRRCQPWACGATSASAKRRNWSRTIFQRVVVQSSAPKLPKSSPSADQLGDAQARRPRVLPSRSACATASGVEVAAASSMPRSAGRTISTWLMAMPPDSWARYSPKADCSISSSSSPKLPDLQPLGPAPHLAQRRDIGRDPGEAVGGELLALQRRGRAPSEPCRLARRDQQRAAAVSAAGDMGQGSQSRCGELARFAPGAQSEGSPQRNRPFVRGAMASLSSLARPRGCAGRGAWPETSTAMLPGLCWFFHILVWALGMSSQAKTSRHAGIDAPLDHQLVGLARLQQIGEVAALDALLAHPHEAGIEGEVVAGGAGAEHHHAAALHDEAGDREGLLARMLEDEIDVVALAGDLPDRLAELAHLLHVVGIALLARRRRAAGPSSRSCCG